MNPELFNNKYYNQLFGGKRQQQRMEDDESSSYTEDTRQRLERIFCAEPKGRKPNPAKEAERAAKKSEAARMRLLSDEDYAAAKGMAYSATESVTNKKGQRFTGLFTFSNGAKAIRDRETGRFKIVAQPNKSYIKGEGATFRATGRRISTADAQKAFGAYWNRRMRDARAENLAKGTKGTKRSKVAAVRRAKEARLSHPKKAQYQLDESSPKGYLYVRREKKTKDCKLIHRAGPALYDFAGVNPIPHKKKLSTGKGKPKKVVDVTPSARKSQTMSTKASAARAKFLAMVEARKKK